MRSRFARSPAPPTRTVRPVGRRNGPVESSGSSVVPLHEVGPIIYGGMLVAAPDRAGEILRFMRDYMPTAPEDLGAAMTGAGEKKA